MVLSSFLVAWSTALAAAPSSLTIDAGPLKLRVVISDSANIFHSFDQLSLWSPYCHRPYRRYFESAEGGGLNDEDQKLLVAHAEVRKRLGYGVLEETFYTDAKWEQSLDAAVKAKRISTADAETEKKIFRHFAPRIVKLVAAQRELLSAAVTGLSSEKPKLKTFAEQASRFWGGGSIEMALYLVVNPSGGGGGSFNGGKLVVEVGKSEVPTHVAIHEAWHAFSASQKNALREAAKQAGTDETTLGEGLAYAVSPGIYKSTGARSDLEAKVAQDFKMEKSFLSDSYVRFNRFGLSLRPLMKEALAKGETHDSFLPKAVMVYRSLAELADALENQPARPRYFCFGDSDVLNALGREFGSRGFDFWGRRFQEKEYESLKEKMRRSDTILFAASRQALLSAPETFQAVWGSHWSDLRARLEKMASGHLRVMTEQGPRVAAWSDDIASLAEVASAEDFRMLLFTEEPSPSKP